VSCNRRTALYQTGMELEGTRDQQPVSRRSP
jgi:hypothetical protein